MTTPIIAVQAEIDQTTRRRDLEPDEIARRVAQLERAIVLLATVESAPAKVARIPGRHLRDKVLRILTRAGGSGSFSEIRLVLGDAVEPYELQNALRDLRDRGLAEPTSERGAVLSGRGKAPTIWRLKSATKAGKARRTGS